MLSRDGLLFRSNCAFFGVGLFLETIIIQIYTLCVNVTSVWCMHVCMGLYATVHTCIGQMRKPGIPRDRSWPMLDGQWSLRSSFLCSHCWGYKRMWPFLPFTCVLRILTQVILVVQQAILPTELSCLFSLNSFSKLKIIASTVALRYFISTFWWNNGRLTKNCEYFHIVLI